METMIITGGSRGIGAATALLAAERGYHICINYHRNQAAAERVVQEVSARGAEAITVQADVSQEADVLRLFDTVDDTWGPVSALVNNAGILEPQLRLEKMSLARVQKVVDINLIGAFLCLREAVKRMSVANGGRGGVIVNVSSAASRLGSPHEFIDYAATKGALDTFTIGLAKEVAEEGIRVNAVRPGLIETEIHASSGTSDRIERLVGGVPMKRSGSAEEVAETILWLLSPASSYVTGTLLDVTGGR